MGLTKIPVLHARWFSHCCLIAQFKGWECLLVQLSTKYIEKIKFLKMGKLENVIFPSSAEPCRILQNSALVPQNSAEHFGENHEILRISAEFRRMVFVPQNNSAELQNVIIFCRSLRNWANLFCGIVRECLVPQNSSAELFIINPFCGILQNQLVRFCGILWNSAD